jgi:hypothetical protein
MEKLFTYVSYVRNIFLACSDSGMYAWQMILLSHWTKYNKNQPKYQHMADLNTFILTL